MKHLHLLTCIGLFCSISVWSQSDQKLKQLSNTVDQKSLNKIAERSEKNHARAVEYAKAHNKPLVIERDDKPNSYLSGIRSNDELVYQKVYNRDAANTTNTPSLYPGGSQQQFIEGSGMTLGVWDGGEVLSSHELLTGNNKVTQMDNASSPDDHATHVSGTLCGKKITSGSNDAIESRGMAYKAKLKAWDFAGDLSEMTTNQNNGGVLVSNHSYGADPENFTDTKPFGMYDYKSSAVDGITHDAPYYLVVVAAGNSRGNFNLADGGYDLITDLAVAKNTLTVAAVNPVTDYNSPSSVSMSNFSSWGPSDDRRIKPDISGQGVNVLSSVAHDVGFQNEGNVVTDNYEVYQGTSMASPNVAGSLILLQELSSNLNDEQYLKAATLKGLAIHTARETGDGPAPDVKYGWGLLNIGAAADLMIVDNDDEDNTKGYQELTLDNEETVSQDVIAQGGDTPLKVTIVWNDPSGPAQNPDNEDDTSPRLVNDLDLRVQGSEGFPKLPWKVEGPNSTEVERGNNTVDNVEQVYIDDAAEGDEYTINVQHKSSLQGGSQDFSMIITGVQNADPSASTANNELEEFSVYPNPAEDQFHLTLGQAQGDVEVSVIDLQGRQVMTKSFQGTSNFDRVINAQSLTKGVYFVKVKTDETQGTRKLIIK